MEKEWYVLKEFLESHKKALYFIESDVDSVTYQAEEVIDDILAEMNRLEKMKKFL